MGIYGESALSASIESVIGANLPALADWQSTIAFVITIVIVTAVSIILGEIVPKRIALANPEKVAAFCAPSMSLFIRLLSPAISFLSFVADRVLALLPIRAAPAVTSMEDILAYVDEGERAGSIAPEESQLFGNVMRLEDWRLATVMTPASDVAWLDLLSPREHNLRLLQEAPHSQLPICKGDLQQVIGIAESHDILKAVMEGDIDFAELPLAPPLFVPASLNLIDLLRTFRQQRANFALVVSEFGLTEGIVTLDDLMYSLVGDMAPGARRLRRLPGGASSRWLMVAGRLAADRRDEGQAGNSPGAAGVAGQLSHRGWVRARVPGAHPAQGGMFYLVGMGVRGGGCGPQPG